MNPIVERFFTAQAETSSGAGCGSRAIGGGVIVGQSRNAKGACIWLRIRFLVVPAACSWPPPPLVPDQIIG